MPTFTLSIWTLMSCKQRGILDSNLSVNPFSKEKNVTGLLYLGKTALVPKELGEDFYKALRKKDYCSNSR